MEYSIQNYKNASASLWQILFCRENTSSMKHNVPSKYLHNLLVLQCSMMAKEVSNKFIYIPILALTYISEYRRPCIASKNF